MKELNRTNGEFVRANEMLENLSLVETSEQRFPTQMTYHELAEVPVRNVDVLDQLEQNIAQIEMLRAKFQFVMRELRYQMKI